MAYHEPRLWLVRTVPGGRQPDPSVLDGLERRRARAFARPGDRIRYVTAHTALRLLLSARTGVTPPRVVLTREPCPVCGGPHGRPALADGTLHFSLAYSDDLCLIAIAGSPVGVDIERVPPPDIVTGLTSALHPEEQAALGRLPEDERPLAFTRIWVRKEAWLKAIGTGLSRGLSTDHVGTGAAPGPAPPGWTITDVTVGPARAAALAVPHG
ncbi:4'-phosphopantetheinyl transferase superfamily protein [Streptomyces sp. NPDC006184]|uniref:4'-phosphopantetheinyl transferase family protein n=1 Tax=Streptomyces sp. NPDC006184 TaxID=3155455 RepID=UPI0033BA01B2